MSGDERRPVIFLAFANDRDDRARYLRNLPEELRRVRERLENAETGRLCEVVVRTNTTVAELLDAFQDSRYRDRIAVFHFGGHAGGYQLLMESTTGRPEFAHAEGLADFLGHQRGLQLVFLNGCSTQPQVEALLQSGVPAVIATSESIDDSAAMELSIRFYTDMAGGATVGDAYAQAVAAVKTVKGGRTRDMYPPDEVDSGRWPWELYVKPGAEIAREWSLPKAAGDPLFGLPPLPEQDLPDTPYRHLQWFRAEDAELFFGRGRDIRAFYELVTSSSTAPILLFYGQSGVGKSSMLAAGLLPRLASCRQVCYARRQRELGLTETLTTALGALRPEESVTAAWAAIESNAGQPLIVIVDQVEEVYTRPRPNDPDELGRFLRALSEVFVERSRRPRGKLVLAFRKEWLADLEERLINSRIPHSKFYLERFDRDGIVDIVEGPTQSERLRTHFRLAVEQGLAEAIADGLLEDRDAPVAPTLEVLLSKMWTQARARNAEAPKFTADLYQELRHKGLLLDDFLNEQMKALHDWNAKVVDTGLALDVLAFHTTPLGTAESRTPAEVDGAYAHQGAVLPGLLQRSNDLYLLIDQVAQALDGGKRTKVTRLAHDTLAPLVRRRFKDSDAPGQRARRILENRCDEWRNGKSGNPLDQADLATVEQGETGMPAWTTDERRLIGASRARRRNRRWTLRGTAATGVAAVTLIIGLYLSARRNESQALSRALAATAKSESQLDLALLLSVEAVRVNATFEARDALLSTVLRPRPRLYRRIRVAGGVLAIAFSPDGTRLVSGGRDGTLRLWDVKSRQSIDQPLPKDLGEIHSVAFSPDSMTLAFGTEDGALGFWNVRKRELIGRLVVAHEGLIYGLAFSPDGKTLASSGDDSTIRLWDVASQRAIGERLAKHRGRVYSVAFSRDGRTLASGGEDSTMRLWEVKSDQAGGEAFLMKHPGRAYSVVFSPDGNSLASGSEDGTIRRWGVRQSQPPGEPLAKHGGHVYSVTFSPDGKTLASGSSDGTLRLWNVDTGQPIGEAIGHTSAVLVVAFSPDSTTLASGGAEGLLFWDVKATRQPIEESVAGHAAPVFDVALSADGMTLASGAEDGTLRLWNATTRQPIGEPLAGHVGPVFAVALSRDGTTLASSGGDGLRVWDAKEHPPVERPLAKHAGLVPDVAFSPDGATLASGGSDGVSLWDSQRRPVTGELLPGQRKPAVGVAFSPDGTVLVSAGADATLRIWDVKTRQPIDSLMPEHNISRVAFSPDGTTLASGHEDGTIRLWDVERREAIGEPLAGHSSRVSGLAFSSDGGTLASGAADGLRLWDVKTRQPLGDPLARHTGRVSGVASSPKGTTLVFGSAAGTLRFWDPDSAALHGLACALVGRNLAAHEWTWFLGKRKYECTCRALPPCRKAEGRTGALTMK